MTARATDGIGAPGSCPGFVSIDRRVPRPVLWTWSRNATDGCVSRPGPRAGRPRPLLIAAVRREAKHLVAQAPMRFLYRDVRARPSGPSEPDRTHHRRPMDRGPPDDALAARGPGRTLAARRCPQFVDVLVRHCLREVSAVHDVFPRWWRSEAVGRLGPWFCDAASVDHGLTRDNGPGSETSRSAWVGVAYHPVRSGAPPLDGLRPCFPGRAHRLVVACFRADFRLGWRQGWTPVALGGWGQCQYAPGRPVGSGHGGGSGVSDFHSRIVALCSVAPHPVVHIEPSDAARSQDLTVFPISAEDPKQSEAVTRKGLSVDVLGINRARNCRARTRRLEGRRMEVAWARRGIKENP